MGLHVSRLPFSLDPLIAEAKRRARQRRILLAAAVVVVGAGGTAGAVLASAPSFTPTRTIQSALVATTWDSDVLVTQDGTIRIPIVLRNESGSTVTLERARAVLSLRGAPVRRIGTAWEAYRACGAAAFGCPPGSGFYPPRFRDPFSAPFRLSPGRYVYTLLVFRLGSCRAVAAHIPKRALRVVPSHEIAHLPPLFTNLVRTITVVYRTANGTVIRQRPSHPAFALLGLDKYRSCL